MKIRFGEIYDNNTIKQIHEEDHESRFLLPKNRIITLIVEDENETLASVMIRLVPEATLVMRKNIPLKTKAECLDYLIQASAMLLRQQNFEDAIVFTNYEGFADVLKKHYGFEKIEADSLRIRLE